MSFCYEVQIFACSFSKLLLFVLKAFKPSLSSSSTVRISGFAEYKSASSITMGLGSSLLMSWNCSLNSFHPSWQGLPSLRREILSSWLPSVVHVITQDKKDSQIISFDNDSHVAKIHNKTFCPLTSNIAITVLLFVFTVFALSDLFMLCKGFK